MYERFGHAQPDPSVSEYVRQSVIDTLKPHADALTGRVDTDAVAESLFLQQAAFLAAGIPMERVQAGTTLAFRHLVEQANTRSFQNISNLEDIL